MLGYGMDGELANQTCREARLAGEKVVRILITAKFLKVFRGSLQPNAVQRIPAYYTYVSDWRDVIYLQAKSRHTYPSPTGQP